MPSSALLVYRTGPFKSSKSITFTGAAGLGLAGSVITLFTVTGEVLVVDLVPFCVLNLGEAAPTATLILGVTGATSLFIAATNAVDIDTGEFWVSTTPTGMGIAVPAPMREIVITDNVLLTPAAQNVNAGTLRFDLLWKPLSSDGKVVAA